MANISTNVQSLSRLQADSDTADAVGLDFLTANTQLNLSYTEFSYGTPVITSRSDTGVTGYIPGGGSFVMDGSHLLSPPALMTHFGYTDNSPASVLNMWGNVTITQYSLSGTITRLAYQSSTLDFDIRGSIPLSLAGTGPTYSLSSISVTIRGTTTVTETIGGSLFVADGVISGTINSLTFRVGGDFITASGLTVDAASAFNLNAGSTDAETFLAAICTGNDTSTGSGNNQTLYGFGGNDTLISGGLASILVGGTGNDTYIVNDAGDTTTELVDEGTDLAKISIATGGGTYTLVDNVENGVLLNTVAFNLTGNTLANTLTGNAAANILDGGAGVDTLNGGAGNDTYVVDGLDDNIIDGAGIDTVQSSIDYVLAASLENLTLTGSADLNGTGNALGNVLTGNAGANILDGRLGADTLIGGSGNDSYLVDNAG
ncbi:MAG: serralysin, partial [Rhodocyclaceae bacterium]